MVGVGIVLYGNDDRISTVSKEIKAKQHKKQELGFLYLIDVYMERGESGD